jgi:hypothetical protein
MPKQYLAIKRALKKKGKSDKEAKRIAAATYNKNHPGNPMSPAHPEGIRRDTITDRAP